jgi:glycosyltransferase involved in cell wall biosynthesis
MNPIRLLRLDQSTPDSNAHGQPHVLLVVDQFPQVLGGGERIVLALASLLPRYGYRASILTFAVHPKSKVAASATCPLYLLPLESAYNLTALRSALVLKEFIEEQRVVLVQTFFESSDIWAGLVTKCLTDAKLIWSRRDMGILRGRKHRIAYRVMANLPDAVFSVSNQVREYTIRVDGVDAARVFTIHNGLDLSRWPQPDFTEAAPERQVIAAVGNIRRVKGYDVLVRAAAIVAKRYPQVRFAIAGGVLEEDYFLQLETLVHQLGLGSHFEFAGNVSHLQPFLAASDFFVLPSRSEGFSNALVEAMASGLAIVATDVGGNAEAIEQGVNGILVPSEDVEGLAAAILQLLSDPSQAQAMRRSARETAMRQFTTEAMMEKTTNIYRALLE